jgi:hypothetical protein
MTRMQASSGVRVLAVVSVALVAVGCSSGSKQKTSPTSQSATSAPPATSTPSATSAPPAPASTSAAAGGVSACSLATASDVASVYGQQFGGAKASNPGGYSSCEFPPPSGGVDSVSFTVAQGSAASVFYSTNEAGYQSKPVSGLGDKAFVSDDGGALGVMTGSTAILVHVVGFENVPPAALQAKQEAFAKVLLSHLG